MARAELPSGTVTFLFTDIEGSTKLLHEFGAEEYAAALEEHRRLVREAFAAHGGVEVDTQGDALFYAFPTAPGALIAAAQATEALAPGPIRVRIGVHTGTPFLTGEGYVGTDVHRAARIAGVGHGGQVLVSSATRALARDVPLTDLGEHRLKDLSAPERIYQLGGGGFPALRSLYRTNLPVPATPFLGRERELGEVVTLLKRSRLLTLTGPGGTGKTRLALQAAGAVADEYPDGVFWVSLAALRDAELVLDAAASALGAEDGLAAQVADKQLLFLFDNFEHVVQAARDVAAVLGACPNLCLLVTSREPLNVTGEQEYAVYPFAHDEGVRFFLARARTVDLAFEADDAVSEICRRLDHLPLALELAAARVKALSSAQILDRLKRSLPLLTGGPRDLPQRQRTLRATIEWSHDLLSAGEQRQFARLSVFRGGCTLEPAEEVCDAELDTLQSLVDKSLLRHTGERYWMLETIREYAAERLEASDQSEEVARRHAGYFLALAEQAEPCFDTADEAVWLDRLARDYDNLRAALGFFRGSPQQLRLACALWRFWLRRGLHREGRRWLEEALSGRTETTSDDVSAFRAIAAFARIEGDAETAERLAAKSRRAAQDIGDRAGEMHAIGALSIIALSARDYLRAADLMSEVEALARELGDDHARAVMVGNRAYLAIQLGEFEDALAHARVALAVGRKIGDSATVISAALNVGLASHALGDSHQACEALIEGLELARASGHRAYLLDGVIVAAAVLVEGDPATAKHLLAAARRLLAELVIELAPAERDLLASVAAQLGDPEAAAAPGSDTADDVDRVQDAAVERALLSSRACSAG